MYLVLYTCTFLLIHISKATAFMENGDVYRLKWPGAITNYRLPPDQSSEEAFRKAIRLRTRFNEEYQCFIPDSAYSPSQKEATDNPSVNAELKLLKPLFDNTQCAYRIESYWSYELCHGKHLRQFHEAYDASGKLVTSASQSHILGLYKESSEIHKTTSRKPKTIQIDTVEYAYYPVEYDNGARCDLTGTPRRAIVKYVCNIDGRGEMLTMKEISTCEYEVIVSTNLLCEHARYDRRDTTNVANVYCHSASGSRAIPIDLVRVSREPKAPPRILPLIFNVNDPEYDEADEESEMDEEAASGYLRYTFANAASASTAGSQTQANSQSSEFRRGEDLAEKKQLELARRLKEQQAAERFDLQLLREFVQGEQCFEGGGSNWWQFQLCFYKGVSQFHAEQGARTTILLGTWNRQKHLDWVAGDPKRRPKASKNERKDVSQFYSDGDTCAETGKKRTVEVKFRCSSNSQSAGVSLMLLEPQVCEYILVAESRLFCRLNPLFDNDGLLPSDVNLTSN